MATKRIHISGSITGGSMVTLQVDGVGKTLQVLGSGQFIGNADDLSYTFDQNALKLTVDASTELRSGVSYVFSGDTLVTEGEGYADDNETEE